MVTQRKETEGEGRRKLHNEEVHSSRSCAIIS
jgi:hypothetical protein